MGHLYTNPTFIKRGTNLGAVKIQTYGKHVGIGCRILVGNNVL